MWFKNIYFFAFTRPFELSEEQLEKHLAEHLYTPCASTEQSHFGWINALGKHGHSTVHSVNGNFLMCARKEEKILPKNYVSELVNEKVELLETEQSRSATKLERETFKEEIIHELLPKCFSKFTDSHVYINAEHNIIVVNSGSRSKAEDILSLMRKVLGTLPVTSISPEKAPDELMTEWVADKSIGENFTLGMEAEFHALGDDGAVARVKNQDLDSAEIRTHLKADKYVVKLALEWDEAISFILTDDLSLKRLKFFDNLMEQSDDIDNDDVLAKLDADFALMAGEVNRLVIDLLSKFNIKATDYLES